MPSSELDDPNFNAEEYVTKVMADSGLEELLKLYTQVVGEVRALDAEKKALVYDNYSKLIAATETIRKVSLPIRATKDIGFGQGPSLPLNRSIMKIVLLTSSGVRCEQTWTR